MNGSNGAGAINLAYHFGARRILLVGMDMKPGPNGEKHWHPDHPKPLVQGQQFEEWRKKMGVLAVDLKTEGVTVVNCTPGSALTCFPMGDLEQEFVKVSTAVLCIRPEPHYRCNAFTEGLKRLGYDIIHRQNPDPAFSPLRSRRSVGAVEQEARYDETMAHQWEKLGGTVIVAENGYLQQTDQDLLRAGTRPQRLGLVPSRRR